MCSINRRLGNVLKIIALLPLWLVSGCGGATGSGAVVPSSGVHANNAMNETASPATKLSLAQRTHAKRRKGKVKKKMADSSEWQQKLTPTLLEQVNTSDPTARIEVIVGLRPDAPPLKGIDENSTVEEIQAAIERQKAFLAPVQDEMASFIEARGGKVLDRYWLINALFAEVPAGTIKPLAQQSKVKYIQENFTAPPPVSPPR